MKPGIPLVLAVFFAAGALAQSPPDPAGAVAAGDVKAQTDTQTATPPEAAPAPAFEAAQFAIRRIDFGVLGPETDTNSSRFREYRDVPSGFVLPFARFAGNDPFRYDAVAERVLRDDAFYRAVADPGPVRIEGEYRKIPHRFGNDARTILEETAEGVLSLSDTAQQGFQSAIESQFQRSRPGVNFAFLSGLVDPYLAAANTIDLALLRERGQIEVNLTRDKPYDVRLTYFHEKRRGDRAGGTSFGFGNALENPEPIDYRTQDVGLSGEWARSWGLVRGAVHLNWFTDALDTLTFDNPFRAVDSTDASAYTSPGANSIGGPAVGRIALPPDTKAITGSLGFLARFAGNTRLTADASLGRWTQDNPFMAYTTNTAISAPVLATDPASLPARSLDGRIGVFSFSSALTSRPLERLTLTARYRRYDLDNKSPRIEFPGYVRFDAVWEDIPRIAVPYSYATDRAETTAAYALGDVTVEAGYRYEKWDRTFRETRKTAENAFKVAAHARASDWAVLRASYERGSRDFDEYDFERSEHASYAEPESPAQLPELRRFDQADKDIQRLNAILQITPTGNSTISLSYLRGKDDYKKSSHGVLKADNEALTVEVDYSPTERWNLWGFYTRENIASLLRGRQSGATPSTDPKADWTADMSDESDTFGGGATVGLVKEKLDLALYGTYQKVDGANDLDSPPGGTPDVAFSIPLFDDTKLLTLQAELAYRLQKGWTVAVGGWLEDYEVRDAATTGLKNYNPGSTFLAADDSDYRAHVLYVRASYRW